MKINVVRLNSSFRMNYFVLVKVVLICLVFLACESKDTLNENFKLRNGDSNLGTNSSFDIHKDVYGTFASLKLFPIKCLTTKADESFHLAYQFEVNVMPKSSTVRGNKPYHSYIEKIRKLWGLPKPELWYISGYREVIYFDENDDDVSVIVDMGANAFATSENKIFLGSHFYDSYDYRLVISVLAHEIGHLLSYNLNANVDRALTLLKEKKRGEELLADFFGGIALGYKWEKYFRDDYPRTVYNYGDNCTSSVRHHGKKIQRQTAGRIGIRVGARSKYNGYNLASYRIKVLLIRSFIKHYKSILAGRSKTINADGPSTISATTADIVSQIEAEEGKKLSHDEIEMIKIVVESGHEALKEQSEEDLSSQN